MSDFSSFEAMTKADTSKLPALFSIEAEQDSSESEKQGRPIFRDVEYIRVIFPGDNTREIFRPATELDKAKYSEEYARFKEGHQQTFSGTPLASWGVLHASTVAELRAIRVFTVEQLADLSELGIGKLGLGGRDMVSKAKAYLSRNTEVDRLKARVAELEEQLAEKAADAPRRGRPPKKEVTDDANAA